MPVLRSSGVHSENQNQSLEDFSLLILFYKAHSWEFSRFPLPADQRVKINSTDTERRARVCMQPETKCNPSRDSRLVTFIHPPPPPALLHRDCADQHLITAQITNRVRGNKPSGRLPSKQTLWTARRRVAHPVFFSFLFFLRWMMLLLIHSQTLMKSIIESISAVFCRYFH